MNEGLHLNGYVFQVENIYIMYVKTTGLHIFSLAGTSYVTEKWRTKWRTGRRWIKWTSAANRGRVNPYFVIQEPFKPQVTPPPPILPKHKRLLSNIIQHQPIKPILWQQNHCPSIVRSFYSYWDKAQDQLYLFARILIICLWDLGTECSL